ncbi:MAG: hypothetical protein HQL17_01440 [Candidatus Omnitrophica bacterium]|nr:hypothetical protein [Candidatus Omnitrophota bacterium]
MKIVFKICNVLILVIFMMTSILPSSYAQVSGGAMISLSAPVEPCVLRGLKIDVRDPLKLDFLFDEGSRVVTPEAFQDESMRLIRYFMASLTIPAKDLWVNLSPYENDRIVQEDLGRTGMGRDLLEQDYVLKQLTASLIYPESSTGKAFWAKVYARAYEKYGTTDIPVDTFNKVWIVPQSSVVYESLSDDQQKISAFVQEIHLKVMLESDYLAANKAQAIPAAADDLSKDMIRQVVLPVLEKEINEGANFAMLRQICYSLVMSSWLKKKLLQSSVQPAGGEGVASNVLSAVYLNQHKTGGIEIDQPQAQTHQIYEQYINAYKKGAYDMIREEVDLYSQELIPRKYFSGGFNAENIDMAMQIKNGRNDNSWRTANKAGNSRYKKQTVSFKPFLKRLVGWAVVGVAFGAVGYALLGGPKKEVLKSSLSSKPASVEDVSGKEQAKKSADYVAMVDQITKAHHEFENSLSDRETPVISAEIFFKRVLAQKNYSSLHAESKDKLVAQMAFRLAQIIERDMGRFGKDLQASGLSSTDVARVLFSLMIRESGGDMLAEQIIGRKVQARAALQDEYLTWWTKLHVAQDELERMPEEFQGFYKDIQKFKLKIEDELKNKRGNTKKNEWTSRSASDMVSDPELHIRMAIIWMNHMVSAKGVPVELVLNEADRVAGIPLSADIQQQLAVNVAPFNVVVDHILAQPKFANHDRRQAQMILLAVLWNGGINRTESELMNIYDNMFSSQEHRMAIQKEGNNELKITEQGRFLAMVPVKDVIVKSLRKNDFKKIFVFTSDRGKALKEVWSGLSPSEKKSFIRAWGKYRVAEHKMLKASNKQKRNKPTMYGKIFTAFSGMDQGSKDSPGDIAKMVRGPRDLGYAGLEMRAAVQKANKALMKVPSKDLKVKRVIKKDTKKSVRQMKGRSSKDHAMTLSKALALFSLVTGIAVGMAMPAGADEIRALRPSLLNKRSVRGNVFDTTLRVGIGQEEYVHRLITAATKGLNLSQIKKGEKEPQVHSSNEVLASLRMTGAEFYGLIAAEYRSNEDNFRNAGLEISDVFAWVVGTIAAETHFNFEQLRESKNGRWGMGQLDVQAFKDTQRYMEARGQQVGSLDVVVLRDARTDVRFMVNNLARMMPALSEILQGFKNKNAIKDPWARMMFLRMLWTLGDQNRPELFKRMLEQARRSNVEMFAAYAPVVRGMIQTDEHIRFMALTFPLGRFVDQAQNLGGIDLTSQDVATRVLGRAGNLEMSLSLAQIELIKDDVAGFMPVVISTQALSDVGQFLGFERAPLK